MLPNETDLAEQFGVSRSTIRAALGELQQSGMISRRHNAGTRVESLHPLRGPESYNQTIATIEDVVQFGTQTDRQVQEIATEIVDDRLAALLCCPIGQSWLRVSSLRTTPGQAAPPLYWTDVHVAPIFAPLVRERIGSYPGLVSTLIEDFAGQRTAEIRQRITAIGVPKHLAGPLVTKPDAHALEIIRGSLDAKERVFILSRSVHPAGRFSYETRLQQQSPANGVYATGKPPGRDPGALS